MQCLKTQLQLQLSYDPSAVIQYTSYNTSATKSQCSSMQSPCRYWNVQTGSKHCKNAKLIASGHVGTSFHLVRNYSSHSRVQAPCQCCSTLRGQCWLRLGGGFRCWLPEREMHNYEILSQTLASFPGSPLAPSKIFVGAMGEPENEAIQTRITECLPQETYRCSYYNAK